MAEKLVTENLRRSQAFDAQLRSANAVDRIAAQFAEAVLFERSGRKRQGTIDKLVKEIVGEAQSSIIPQGQRIGRANAENVASQSPAPVNLADPVERGAAMFRARMRARDRVEIVRESVTANGGQLNAALTRYWLEPSEGTAKEKEKRLIEIHTRLEQRRKDYEERLKAYNEGKAKNKPAKPSLDFVSEMTAASKQDIRVQARRAGTDTEIATFQSKGYKQFVWIAPNGLSACPDCLNRKNVVLTIPEWESVGRPGSGQTVCGIHCFCMLIPKETAAFAPNLITSRETKERGPLTSETTLDFLNSRRLETTTTGGTKQITISAPKPTPKTVPVAPDVPLSSNGMRLPNKGVTVKLDAVAGQTPDAQELAEVSKSIFGKSLTESELGGLIGAPEGSEIALRVYKAEKSIAIVAQNEKLGLEMGREVYRKGKAVISENTGFFLDEKSQGKGIGFKAFAEQVDAMRRAGVTEIRTYAMQGDEHNGYYTWARLGYDAPIPAKVRKLMRETPGLSKAVTAAKDVSDLMKTPEGRDFWKAKGVGFNGKFTVTKDQSSLSEKVLNAYVRIKQRAAR